MKSKILPILFAATLLCSCKVEFSPNAPWKDVPVVYCVLDIEEDTVWARVQRCYLGEDSLYGYSTIADSNNYPIGDIQVELKAWASRNPGSSQLSVNDQLVHQWQFQPTMADRMPDGEFSAEPQPVYYCVPGSATLIRDSNCVFQLIVTRTSTGDTLAQATTNLVRFIDYDNTIAHGDPECIVETPSAVRGHHFGFIPSGRNKISWYAIPGGRIYQSVVRFYYRKGQDTLGFDINGGTVFNEHNNLKLIDNSITQTKFLSTIKSRLAQNQDSLFNVNYVDVKVLVGNEDLNCYYVTHNAHLSNGQEYTQYTNIRGGLGIFASRRTHIVARVPSDSTGKPDYLPDQLVQLGVGFYGHFGANSTGE